MTLISSVDEFACAVHGDCVLVAPGVFAVDDIAVVTGEGSEEEILAAARACPAGAITVIDKDSGERIYP
jgi:ferredoxin